MKWKDLIAEIPSLSANGGSDAELTSVEYDSRRVRKGSVFVAMRGGSNDGNRYVKKALEAGAVGIITDFALTVDYLTVYRPDVGVLEVEHGRRALAAAKDKIRELFWEVVEGR